ncbi:hypothetical protein EDI_333970 [Entamoeba dispar SAW760]|uniref:Uncharacterized protein n=1 Tax=Entamoeba dispar (strain ATCC PRA-260 / SAW760) TaxID=370354 RepID=B0EJX0_ENTDS|nr:uncharacterized protein EDI_333970 [Entamoeba dispar SAW760]EDR25179.1 hypothetical protein EDI_333970 [Entamoeba dispar SAW760]|eukprot:EDR25179.1 hypothetical protein EDI_333970 [Entamoeba dispar SAW760]
MEEDKCLILIEVPLDITIKEVSDILDNCGKVTLIESYEIDGMIKKDGCQDLLVKFEEDEGRTIAKQIGGVKYKDWVIKVKTVEGYYRYKKQEQDDSELQNQIKEGITNIINYFKNLTKEPSENQVIVVDSSGQQRVFQKKEKPLPPIPVNNRPLPSIPQPKIIPTKEDELNQKTKEQEIDLQENHDHIQKINEEEVCESNLILKDEEIVL